MLDPIFVITVLGIVILGGGAVVTVRLQSLKVQSPSFIDQDDRERQLKAAYYERFYPGLRETLTESAWNDLLRNTTLPNDMDVIDFL